VAEAPDGLSIAEGDVVRAPEYRAMREAVGWRPVEATDGALQSALDATWNVTARDPRGRLLGLVRLLDDGLLYAAVWDMIVLPELQRKGIGAALFERVLLRTGDRHLVTLVATPAGAGLYRRAGFSEGSSGSIALFRRPTG
jgi:GNAT superfamily N-acetyltransferase